METLRKFIEKLRPDRLISTGSVFPEILADKIAADISVEKIAREEGMCNEPPTESTVLSVTEHKIVSEVQRLRMDGFNRFNEHMETYARRLREASNSKAELRAITQLVLGDYEKAVADWKNKLVNSNERVRDRKLERDAFRKQHRLQRTSHDRGSILFALGLALLLVLFESLMNGYFFAAGNELGLVGGVSVAIVISIVNVGFLSILGFLSRNINHCNYFRKIIGLIWLALAITFSVIFNLAVAHFREATASLPWEEAVIFSVRSFQESPFGMENIESWLLLCMGVLVCTIAFWKAWAFDDPYPDYGRVSRRLEFAREEYAELLQDAFSELEELRDDAVEELDEARRALTQNISEATDVIAARIGLGAQLNEFLSHADQVVQQILALYRATNRKARTTPAPEYFLNDYKFNAVNVPALPKSDTIKPKTEDLTEIDQIVTATIDAITQRYSEALMSFRSIGLIEGEQEVSKI